MSRIVFKGTGQLNGVVIIDKEIEVDQYQISSYTGQKRDEVITATLQIYYPGVKINPRQISVNIFP